MERKPSSKDIINIIKSVLPAVFCIVIIIVAVNTGGADLKKVPRRIEAAYETPLPDAGQTPEPGIEVLDSNKDKIVKKKNNKTKKDKKTEVNIAKLQDGTFTGEGTGFGGGIKSEVTIKNGKITNIKILSAPGETPSYFNKAKAVMAKVIEKQTCNVDSVSGATYSSNGIIESIRNALRLAKGKKALKKSTVPAVVKVKKEKKSSSQKKDKNSQKKKTGQNTSAADDGLNDGLYTGTGTGFGGDIKVNVRVKKGKITKIVIVSAGFETPSYFSKAKSIISTIIKKQSTDVDVVSGATYSSNGIKEAVNNALLKAVKKKNQTAEDKSNDNNTDSSNKDNNSNTDSKDDSSNTSGNSDNKSTDNNSDTGSNGDNNDIEEEGEWVIISETSQNYIYPVVAYCEPYSDDFEGYDIGFKIIITTVITVEENAVKSTRTTTNNYVSAVELEQDTIDYVMKTGNWSFLNMAANGTANKAGLFEQLVSSNSTESFDVVSGATCSSDALTYGIKSTLADITLGKTVVIN